jgi:TPR repeat protein
MASQIAMARFHTHGQAGFPLDFAAADHWYEQAGKNGSATGLYNQAECLRVGRGVAQNLGLAADLMEKASEAKYVPACILCFHYGGCWSY